MVSERIFSCTCTLAQTLGLGATLKDLPSYLHRHLLHVLGGVPSRRPGPYTSVHLLCCPYIHFFYECVCMCVFMCIYIYTYIYCTVFMCVYSWLLVQLMLLQHVITELLDVGHHNGLNRRPLEAVVANPTLEVSGALTWRSDTLQKKSVVKHTPFCWWYLFPIHM